MTPTPRAGAALAVVAVLLFASSAAGLGLNAGQWRFVSNTTSSMMPEPQSHTETKCITEEIAKQDPLAELVEKGGCKVLSRSEAGDTLTFEVECAGQGKMPVKSRGKGTFTSSGDKANGKMDLSVEMPEVPNMPAMGGKVTMQQSWTGERLGACEAPAAP